MTNLIKFTKWIKENIRAGKFVFLNSTTREIKNKTLSTKKNLCTFFRNLEVYPEREMAFSPLLINIKVGKVKSGFFKKYTSCNFHSNSEECRNCKLNYLQKKTQTREQ